MSERYTPRPEGQPQRQPRKTGMSIEDYIADKKEKEAAQNQRPQVSRPTAPSKQSQAQPRQKSHEAPRRSVDIIDPKTPRKRRFGQRALVSTLAATLVVSASAAAYSENVGGIQDMVSGSAAAANEAAPLPNIEGMEKLPLEKLGTGSLELGQCDDPLGALAVIYVSGEYPLVPLISTTANPTLGIAEPFLTEEKISDLSEKKQKELEDNVTEDGYPHVLVKDLPLVISGCEIEGASAINESNDLVRDAVRVYFKDPTENFKEDIVKIMYPINDKADAELDYNKGQYINVPNSVAFLELTKDENLDEVYNKSITDVVASFDPTVNPLQLPALLAEIENSIVDQLQNEVDGQENITYEEGTSLIEAVDALFYKRLVVDEAEGFDIVGGDYDYFTDAPNDPVSKTELYENDPATGSSFFKLHDTSRPFKITEARLEFGPLAKPDIPEPTPTPTPTPTETVAP